MNDVTALEYKDYVKFLGVLIDKHLTWKQHIDYIASDQQNCWFNRDCDTCTIKHPSSNLSIPRISTYVLRYS